MSNFHNYLTQPFKLIEHIQTKRKITNLDVHDSLPWILFSDKDNNIVIFDVISKHPLRAFTLNQYFPEELKIKNLQFFHTNDDKFINNYEINDFLRIKGIPLHIRNSLIIVTTDKYIFFYSYILQNFVRFISYKSLNNQNIIKCEIFNYLYCIILIEDGSINIWNLKDWVLGRVLLKSNFNNRSLVDFINITLKTGEKFIIAANKLSQIFKIDINQKEPLLYRIDDDKLQNECTITQMDFNSNNNNLILLNKNYITILNLNNKNNSIRIPNFNFNKNVKITGILNNYSKIFDNYNSLFIYGKCPVLECINLNIDHNVPAQKIKIEQKNLKDYLSYSFDLDKFIIKKINDNKIIKINKAKILLNSNEFLILGTNKGIVIIKIDDSYFQPIVTLNISQIDLNETYMKKIFFYEIFDNNLKEIIYTKNEKEKNSLIPFGKNKDFNIMKNIFKYNNQSKKNLEHRYEIKFSFDLKYLSCIDEINSVYTLFKIKRTESENSFDLIKSGNCVSFEWCPFSNTYAIITCKSYVKLEEKNKNSEFILTIYELNNMNTNILYEILNLPIHKILGGPFIGIYENCKINNDNKNNKINENNYNYSIGKNIELNFYYWNEKVKINLNLKEIPEKIYYSNDLEFMIISFEEKFILYQINQETFEYNYINIYEFKILNGLFYENFIFIFVTDYGFYFIFCNDLNSYPFKLFNSSDQMNYYHLKLSKKLKEKHIYYTNKSLYNQIIGIYENCMFTINNNNEIEIYNLEHPFFKIILLIKKKDFINLSNEIDMIDKKYLLNILSIFKYYFMEDEEIYRKIFTQEQIINLKLYVHLPFFKKDYIKIGGNKEDIEKLFQKNLINSITAKNILEINEINSISNNIGLKVETKSGRCLNEESYLKALLNKKRYFEAYIFNQNYNINKDMDDKILVKAFQILNK